MTDSWRDDVSEQAQVDLDELTNLALGFGANQLQAHGELLPFALVRRTDGELEPILVEGLDDDADPADLVDAHVAEAVRRREEIRAAIFLADITAEQLGGDAIRALLEHREGVNIALYLPYQHDEEGTYTFGELVGSPGLAQVWASDAGGDGN